MITKLAWQWARAIGTHLGEAGCEPCRMSCEQAQLQKQHGYQWSSARPAVTWLSSSQVAGWLYCCPRQEHSTHDWNDQVQDLELLGCKTGCLHVR